MRQTSNCHPGADRDPLAFQPIGVRRRTVAGFKMVPGLRRDDVEYAFSGTVLVVVRLSNGQLGDCEVFLFIRATHACGEKTAPLTARMLHLSP